MILVKSAPKPPLFVWGHGHGGDLGTLTMARKMSVPVDARDETH